MSCSPALYPLTLFHMLTYQLGQRHPPSFKGKSLGPVPQGRQSGQKKPWKARLQWKSPGGPGVRGHT